MVEAVLADQRLQLEAGHLHVGALPHRLALDLLPARQAPWQGRKAARKLEVGFPSPEAEEAGQPLPLGPLLDPGLAELGPELAVEGVLARLFQLVQCPRLSQLPGQRRGRFGSGQRLLQESGRLVGGDGAVELSPRLSAEPQDLLGRVVLVGPEPVARDLDAHRKRGQLQQAAHHGPLDVGVEAEPPLGDGEPRGWRQGGLDELRFRHAEIVERRLQPLVLEEGDLHRAVGGQ